MKSLSECSVTVIGLGLMGASLCIDLKQRNLCREVRGVTRNFGTILRAFHENSVDLATTDLSSGVAGADIVILSTPVRAVVQMLETLGPILWPGTVVMDMGSTKAEICAAMERLPPRVQPIGGHPMTGKETAGYASAESGLYEGAPWVLTPLPRTSNETVELASELAEAIGAFPTTMQPARHDQLVAAISHLPFLMASALVHAVSDCGDEDPAVWDLAAGGFRDTSRVAASDTQMFLDILVTNREAVLAQMDTVSAHFQELRRLLAENDEDSLWRMLSCSQATRAAWQQKKGAFTTPAQG
ncbi:MAG: prephenate dehydrogenase [Caldilineaceae bacterium]|nr:prephenate dehydrogenase [Caldilineaceae bacterium]MDE0312681.1 prephenate dehydrogenase [Caldilineaceae bacterium]